MRFIQTDTVFHVYTAYGKWNSFGSLIDSKTSEWPSSEQRVPSEVMAWYASRIIKICITGYVCSVLFVLLTAFTSAGMGSRMTVDGALRRERMVLVAVDLLGAYRRCDEWGRTRVPTLGWRSGSSEGHCLRSINDINFDCDV